MIMRSTLRVVVGILMMAGAFTAAACHRHHTPAERADWMAGKIARELKLDEQQKAKLAAVKDEVLAARAESKKERRAMMDEVITQVQNERLDQAKITQLFEQHQAGQTRMLTRVLPKVAEWHASLRPEQKAEAVEHLRKWIERHEGGE